MPWRDPMSAKQAFVWDVNGGMSVSDAAELHGIARSCAYKWIRRYRQYGDDGLEELARAPLNSPAKTPSPIVDELVALKRKYGYGPAKLVAMLEEKHGAHVLAPSTAGTILARLGLVKKRRSRRPGMGAIAHPAFSLGDAGESMTADYKGQFRMRNGRMCYPLTIADPASRYIMAIDAFASTAMDQARNSFERVFREYGVPRQLLTDNGTPFCSSMSLGGITTLSRWWIELGIVPLRIAPGKPQQNGIHERMHRTLKDWIRERPQIDLRGHQRSFDAFRREFNHIRPHQSLDQKKPVTAFKHYRPFPRRIKPFAYDSSMEVRAIRSNGEFKWKGHLIYASEVLKGANIGLFQVDEATWEIYFGHVPLGWLDGINKRVRNRRPDRPTEPDNVKKEEKLIEEEDDD